MTEAQSHYWHLFVISQTLQATSWTHRIQNTERKALKGKLSKKLKTDWEIPCFRRELCKDEMKNSFFFEIFPFSQVTFFMFSFSRAMMEKSCSSRQWMFIRSPKNHNRRDDERKAEEKQSRESWERRWWRKNLNEIIQINSRKHNRRTQRAAAAAAKWMRKSVWLLGFFLRWEKKIYPSNLLHWRIGRAAGVRKEILTPTEKTLKCMRVESE